ncbi:MAG: sulfatase-like hydrolase/transferase [Bryobacterales bacterium]|nr:sulfatase-like hydrolase/transferase [Bryobacterales bacterium]
MTLTRRAWLGSALAAFGQTRTVRPNVLIFLSDQETALLPGPAHTPNRHRLGGVRFTHAFCNTPQCSPARAAILTGLDPHKAGVLTNVDKSSLGQPLSPSTPNIGSVFQAAGYHTGYFGKWHLSDSRDLAAYGFSDSELNGADEDTARRAAAWMRAQTGPWLAFVSILDPHRIYDIPRKVAEVNPREGVRKPFSGLEDLAGKPSEQREYAGWDQGRATRKFTPEDWLKYRSYYLQLVEHADFCFGLTLEGISHISDTIVLYSSDHGDETGEHGLPYKGPFMYEELLRIPLVMAGPGTEKLKARTDELVTQTDIAPTLAGLAGLRWPSTAGGRDLTAGGAARDAVLLEYYAKQKWKNPIRTIRARRYKLNWYNSGHQELYDLDQDPHETHNLAGKPSVRGIQTELERRIGAWRGPIT